MNFTEITSLDRPTQGAIGRAPITSVARSALTTATDEIAGAGDTDIARWRSSGVQLSWGEDRVVGGHGVAPRDDSSRSPGAQVADDDPDDAAAP
jgi:hypothetical protein